MHMHDTLANPSLTFCIVALADAEGWIRRGKEELAAAEEVPEQTAGRANCWPDK